MGGGSRFHLCPTHKCSQGLLLDGSCAEEGLEEARPVSLRPKVGCKRQTEEEAQELGHEKMLKLTYPRMCKQKHRRTTRARATSSADGWRGAAFCATLNTQVFPFENVSLLLKLDLDSFFFKVVFWLHVCLQARESTRSYYRWLRAPL